VIRDAVPATEWEGQPVGYWRERWRVPAAHLFRSIGSTSDALRELAARGAAPGTVAVADVQTAGRGRHGRSWVARPGHSLLMSLLLRPAWSEQPAPGALPLRIGLRLARVLRRLTGAHVGVKWPNDVVLDEHRKLAGILCEAAATCARWSIVAGIGINVHQQPGDWPDTLRGGAASVSEAAGTAVERSALATALIDELRPLFAAPLLPLGDDEMAEYAALDVLAGRAVAVRQPADDAAALAPPLVQGTGAGIDPDGALLVDTGSVLERVTTGTIGVAGRTPARLPNDS
jgi:BirA family transcriptional regulator, biotin operon repressor / biotin---[acetyl-CoA-carboxylase] ligase